MLELIANFRGKYKQEICDLCNDDEDTTEHMFTCKGLQMMRNRAQTPLDMSAPSKDLATYIRQALNLRKGSTQSALSARTEEES